MSESQVLDAPVVAPVIPAVEEAAPAAEEKTVKVKALPLPPIKMGAGEVPRDGVVTVTLFDIDPLWIVNYRTEIETDRLVEVRKMIDEQGMLQPVGGVWSKDGSRIHLAFGFCRLECRYQLALRKLVKDYNDFFGRVPGDDGFIDLTGVTYVKRKVGDQEKAFVVNDSLDTISRMKHREQIRDMGQEWKDKYDNALKVVPIQVRTIEVGDPDTEDAKQIGKIRNITENKGRNNPSLWDELSQVDTMLSMGIKAKHIAESLGKSEPVISKYRKVFNFPATVKETWTPAVLKEQLKLADEAAVNLAVATRDTCLNEFQRRLRLSETHEEVIGISHCREFVDEVTHSKDPLRVREAFALLKELVDVGEDGKPHGGRVMELGALRSKMRDARKAMKLPDAPVPTAPAGTVVAPTVSTGNSAPSVPATDPTAVDELAELQKHAEANIATAQAAVAPATVTPSKPEVVRSEDAAIQSEIAAANAAGGTSEPSLDDMNPDDAALEALIAEEAAGGDLAAAAAAATTPAGVAKVPEGQLRTKTTEAVASKYRPRNPESLEKQAWQRLKDASNPTANPFDVAGNLVVVTELFSAIGMDKEYTEVNRSFVKYEEEARVYFAKLEEVASKHGTEDEKQALASLRPKYTVPGSEAAKAAA